MRVTGVHSWRRARRIRWIIVTHTHPRSFAAGARARAAHRRARHRIAAARRTGGRTRPSRRSTSRRDGERLALGDFELTAIHTPGHASNCVCYLLERERLLFTGDHVLEGVSPVILPPDGDMAAYLHSLDKLLAYDFERIAPGHGDVMERGKEVLEALRAHRLAREDKVLRTLAGCEMPRSMN